MRNKTAEYMGLEPQEESLAMGPRAASHERRSLAAHDLSVRQRLMVMLLNYISLFHVIAILGVILIDWAPLRWRALAVIGVIYLLPALAARVIVKCFPIRGSVLTLGSSDFLKWWALLNLQMLFCRLPVLEECMRFFPAVYSAWLRLWGSKIGRLVFWSPGTQILDRSYLEVGDDVLFGVEVRVIPHLMVRNETGQNEVLLAPVKIGARAVVGGYSLLGPGSEIAAGEATSARLMLHPFSKWRDGRRMKP